MRRRPGAPGRARARRVGRRASRQAMGSLGVANATEKPVVITRPEGDAKGLMGGTVRWVGGGGPLLRPDPRPAGGPAEEHGQKSFTQGGSRRA
ncbi:hypothetical protein Acsp04_57380 [Actinomadura sp. NBRC 104425]|nr:hypothetical protein Acsp04_57380 [Actinomadura sp. NBRC 104425]